MKAVWLEIILYGFVGAYLLPGGLSSYDVGLFHLSNHAFLYAVLGYTLFSKIIFVIKY